VENLFSIPEELGGERPRSSSVFR